MQKHKHTYIHTAQEQRPHKATFILKTKRRKQKQISPGQQTNENNNQK